MEPDSKRQRQWLEGLPENNHEVAHTMLNLQVGGQNLPKMVVPEVSKLPMFPNLHDGLTFCDCGPNLWIFPRRYFPELVQRNDIMKSY